MKIQELNVYVVAFNSGKILLLKRHTGFWEFPGGGVDWGEEPEKSAMREFKEETGLQATSLEFLGVSSATYKKEENDKHSVYIIYKADTDSDKFVLSKEHAEGRWVQPSEAAFMRMALNAEPVLELLEK